MKTIPSPVYRQHAFSVIYALSILQKLGRLALILVFLVGGIFSPQIHAGTVEWIADGDGSLLDPANWSPGLPGINDDVVFHIEKQINLFAYGNDVAYASAAFTGSTSSRYTVDLGNAETTWRLPDGLHVDLPTDRQFIFGVGTFLITNEEGTATLSFGTVSNAGRLVFRQASAPTVVVDHLNIQSSVEPWYTFAGRLDILHGSTISAPGQAIHFGRQAGYTFTANYLGGENTINGGTISIGGIGSGVVTVTGEETSLLIEGGSTFYVGKDSANNHGSFVIEKGAAVTTDLTDSQQLGANVVSNGNTMTVTGIGSSFKTLNHGHFYVGQGGSENVLTVADGGLVDLRSGGYMVLGGQVTSNDNILTVTGEGSRLLTASTGNDYTSVGTRGSNNQLVIENNGFVETGALYVGFYDTAENNTVTVDTGGVLQVYGTIQTRYADTNTVTVNNGGTLQFTRKNPAINIPDGGGAVSLGDGGIVSFVGINDAPTAAIGNLTYVGNNALRLNNAKNAAISGDYTFDDTSLYARLDLQNGGEWQQTSGALMIGDGGTLSGSGTVNAGTTEVTSGGMLSIGNSPGTMTFLGDLILDPGSHSAFEINGFGMGQYDLALGGVSGEEHGVVFDGTLHLIFESGFHTVGSAFLFNFGDYYGNFETVDVTGLASGYSAEFDGTTGMVTVVPEPVTSFLILLGLGVIAGWRRRFEILNWRR